MSTISEIIEKAGGYASIVDAYRSRGIEIDPSTPRKWKMMGIPAKHWPLIIELAGVTPNDLLSANLKAQETEAAA